MAEVKNATHELDNLFAAFAKKAEEEAKSSSSKGNFVPRDYEEIKYTGLEQSVPSILRVVGGPYDSNVDPYTCRTVNISRIVGDDGKKFRVIRPSITDDPNYIINRIISAVMKPSWDKATKEKFFPIKDKFPEIFNLVEKNGVQKGDSQYNYEKGWKGKEVFIMNVIDREHMDWHKENKHTMLLAKSVTEKDGNVFVDEGISSYAAGPEFTQLYKYYGSWEKYDIAITKTGEKSGAFIIENATRTPEKAGDKAQFISDNTSLTDEEKSWEKYDLDKLFRITTSTKIYNRLKGTIARIDAALNTHFLEDLKKEVDEEKAKFDELYGRDEDENTSTKSESSDEGLEFLTKDAPQEEAAPQTRTRTRVSSAPVWNILPFAGTLSDNVKSKIKGVTKGEGNFYDIVWDYPEEELAQCPECKTVAPLECDTCPACGESFVG